MTTATQTPPGAAPSSTASREVTLSVTPRKLELLKSSLERERARKALDALKLRDDDSEWVVRKREALTRDHGLLTEMIEELGQ